ncbi:MAG: hypothetical protein IK077_11100, partial [Thermoguttaceae bacterium]|nr:hypothetical protein [Thermoguttaceae bacterium]
IAAAKIDSFDVNFRHAQTRRVGVDKNVRAEDHVRRVLIVVTNDVVTGLQIYRPARRQCEWGGRPDFAVAFHR